LFCGKFIPKKRPLDLVGAAKLLLRDAAGFLNQTEISRAYVAADCLVLPSDYRETWGLVVNEAMASGLPCIISDQCGCAEDLGSLGMNEVFSCGNISELRTRFLASQWKGISDYVRLSFLRSRQLSQR
jgi:hypothetical protein